jgi:hypothetical protein
MKYHMNLYFPQDIEAENEKEAFAKYEKIIEKELFCSVQPIKRLVKNYGQWDSRNTPFRNMRLNPED